MVPSFGSLVYFVVKKEEGHLITKGTKNTKDLSTKKDMFVFGESLTG